MENGFWQHLNTKTTSMKSSNFIVRIPEPCHEDWNKMLPDEKGKFCLSCNKSVFDFSGKTDAEIKTILLEHKDQKVCGHFKKSQVDRPLNLTVDSDNLPRNMSITRFFAVALFIVFGSLLFDCTAQNNRTVGKLAIVRTPYTEDKKEEKMPPDSIIPLETISAYEHQTLGGAVAIQETIPENEILRENECMLTGDVIEEYVEEDQTSPDSLPLNKSEYLEGKIMYIQDEPANESKDSLANASRPSAPENINMKSAALIVYPNPNSGEFSIRYDVKKRADVKVRILDVKGSTVKTLVNMPGQYEGKYTIPVNLSDLPSGIYFVDLVNNGERFIEKVIIEK